MNVRRSRKSPPARSLQAGGRKSPWKIVSVGAAAGFFFLVPFFIAQASAGKKDAAKAADEGDSRIVNPPCPKGQRGVPRFPDMALWDGVVKTHVRRGIVDYRGIQKDDRFKKFLAQWDCMDVRATVKLPEEARAALWVNLHNAMVVGNVLRHYPIASPSLVPGFYKLKVARVGVHSASVHDLSTEATRYRDPRVAFALCRGTVGSPPLRSEAYVAERFKDQIDEQTKQFILDKHHVFIDSRRHFLRLSETFRLYQFAIEAKYKTVFHFLAERLPKEDADAVLSGTLEFQFVDDTDLNGEGAY